MWGRGIRLLSPVRSVRKSAVYVGKFKELKHTLVIRCSCQQRFKVEVNFRQYHRRKVKLIGDVLNVSIASTGWRKVTVIDLSMVGLWFEVVGHTGIEKGIYCE